MKQITRLALVLACACGTQASAQDHPFETDELRKPSFQTGGNCLITNVTVHSAVGPAQLASVLVTSGDIAAIGPDLEAPDGYWVIDGRGGHLTPGVVDCHSHMAIEGGINEGTLSITCDVDISDVVNADDLTIYRALAGGTTTARLLHGSANAIGGRHEVIKLRWHKGTEDLRFDEAPEGVKFALGENPKRRGGGGGRGGGAGRFPGTRMGVEAVFYRAFSRAREYQAEWKAYEAARAAGQDPVPVRRDLRLDALVGILDGTIDVHSHCYRADEILMLLRAAEHFGFRVKTLQHVLEGYKVAHEIAEHGAGGSTFGDWWAYKIEAYDAIPHNAALMDEAGVLTSLNSDSGEMVRRLFSEAAKSVRYARMDPVRALALVTINPAKQLGIDPWVGSIEVGKDADLVLHNGDPLSALSRVEWTLVDGELEFERRDAFELDSNPPEVPALSEIDPALVEAGWTPESDGEAIAIVGATIHPVTAPVIENGTLIMQDGRIAYIGPEAAVPASTRMIDATGQHVWPGIVALGTGLGLYEIGQVTATVDNSEIGGNQPDLRVSAALSAESAHIPVTRTNGITRAQSAPQGGGPIRGQSSIIRLEGDTWEELLMVDRDMLQVSFPRMSNDAKEKKKSKAVKDLEQLFEDGREYARLIDESQVHGSTPPPFEPRLAALAPYVRGEKKVALHADNAQTILSALQFVEEQELDCVLYGVREGWKVADALAEAQVPVVIGPVLFVPSSDYDPYDAAYANAAVLARAGVPFAIMSDDGQNPRNVAFHAAMASAFGLPHEEAVRSITYYAARVLGLEDEIGSLAPGKIADVVITDGDLLEITTHVEAMFIDGVQAPLVNRQTEFYDRYRSRLMRLQDQ